MLNLGTTYTIIWEVIYYWVYEVCFFSEFSVECQVKDVGWERKLNKNSTDKFSKEIIYYVKYLMNGVSGETLTQIREKY